MVCCFRFLVLFGISQICHFSCLVFWEWAIFLRLQYHNYLIFHDLSLIWPLFSGSYRALSEFRDFGFCVLFTLWVLFPRLRDQNSTVPLRSRFSIGFLWFSSVLTVHPLGAFCQLFQIFRQFSSLFCSLTFRFARLINPGSWENLGYPIWLVDLAHDQHLNWYCIVKY